MYRNLEAELKRKGINRRQLAEMLGINISTVSAKMTGKAPLSWDEIERIRDKAFNNEFTADYLFNKNTQQAK